MGAWRLYSLIEVVLVVFPPAKLIPLNSFPGRGKPMTYKIDSCRFLDGSALIRDKGWLAQRHDNVTVWDNGSW